MNQLVEKETNPFLEKKVEELNSQGIKVKKITKVDASYLGLEKEKPLSISSIINRISLKVNDMPFISEGFNVYILEISR